MTSTDELNRRFAGSKNELDSEVRRELETILRLYEIDPEELFFKWESYSLRMGPETILDLKTARDFRKDLQAALERDSRSKNRTNDSRKTVAATPKAGGSSDVFGM
jgi:DNA polymerase alpha subunit B